MRRVQLLVVAVRTEQKGQGQCAHRVNQTLSKAVSCLASLPDDCTIGHPLWAFYHIQHWDEKEESDVSFLQDCNVPQKKLSHSMTLYFPSVECRIS